MKRILKFIVVASLVFSAGKANAQVFQTGVCCSPCAGWRIFQIFDGARCRQCNVVTNRSSVKEHAPGSKGGCPSCLDGACRITDTNLQTPMESEAVERPVLAIGKKVVEIPANVIKTVADNYYLGVANSVRIAHGCSPLVNSPVLESGARNHAETMAFYRRLFHASGGYGSGEIVAYNYGVGVEGALNQWLASPRHRSLLLNNGFRYAGIAAKKDRFGTNWCVMRFM